ncbi:M56 family metallopeptidase [Proteiniphilum sp. UBA5384]|uniref:M56 family metallopeptidase n=1 Tax=Proteiniphilum sp. UBA5384 TaxID=1947279 RepID=UPI0025D16606|nr:M56 family metallopeptidase [Proteiniphilum sp. UBA5384]
MLPILTYLLQVNIALVLFYLLYVILLKRDTFLRMRRFYFLSVIVFSLLYPFCAISGLCDIWPFPSSSLQEGTATVFLGEPRMDVTPGGEAATTAPVPWREMLILLYIAITVVFILRFLFQLFSIYRIRLRSKNQIVKGIPIYQLKEDITPFSFFNLIFIHPGKHSGEELFQILLHEHTHARQCHSFDIMLIELVCLFSWWNPFVWLMKREMAMNLEYLADNGVLREGIDSREYQYHLLRLTYHETAVQIVNNFNVSQLKQRIMMMNKAKSSTMKVAKYLLIVPLFFLFVTANSVYAALHEENPVVSNDLPEPPPEKKAEVGEIFVVVDEQPEFPGGVNAMMQFLGENIRYPVEAQKSGIQGRVICNFLVMKDGSIDSVKVVRGVDPLLDAEAVRVLQSMPQWVPGKQRGEEVNVRFTVPIVFNLDRNKPTEEEKEAFQEKMKDFEKAEFAGGEKAFMTYLADNIRYPVIAQENGIQGLVSAVFSINSKGKVTFVKFEKGVDPSLEAEVKRVIEKMPDWTPAKIGGEATSMTTGAHFVFRLQGEGISTYHGPVPDDAVVVVGFN